MSSTISTATPGTPESAGTATGASKRPLGLVGLRPSPGIESYDSVRWYRRQWFALFPLCAPLLVVIALTGGVYTKANRSMKRYSDAEVWYLTVPTRVALAALALFITVMTIVALVS